MEERGPRRRRYDPCSGVTVDNLRMSEESRDEKGEEEEPQCFAYEEYFDNCGHVLVRKRDHKSSEAEAEKNYLSFKFVYGLKEKMWVKRDYLEIHSTDLIQMLNEASPGRFNPLPGSKKIKIYASQLFHGRIELINEQQKLDLSEVAGQSLDFRYMLQFLNISFEEVLEKYEAMKNEGLVSWDMLWAFFPAGTEVAYRCHVTGEELCGIAENTSYDSAQFTIGVKMWNYDCQTWESYSVKRIISGFAGACKFTTLEIHPLQFKSNLVEAENKFLAKGEWFGKLSMKTRNRFMHYKGLMYMTFHKEAVNGRVMIDLLSFAKMKPDYSMGNATPSPEILRTNQVQTIDISTDDKRKYAPAIVYGFSFQTKMWGVFDICGFEEIVFNQLAFDALVMDKVKKDTIYGLVQKYERNQDERSKAVGQYESQDDERLDPIAGKGEGCIFLCYGPPGTGKTFTAESISEKLRAPLWSLSVSELGNTPAVLENKLVKVLDVAASWGAILLLDEADIYMEKRRNVDLERNVMTGIFLRNLEYYRGVLFLTTNRVVAFDDAFCSRISMFLYYGKHSRDDRRTIWKNLLEPLNIQGLLDHRLDVFTSYELNAREIRNVVQLARTLAKRNGESLNGTYLTQSLVTLAESIEELKRVTGESNAHTSMI